MLFILLFASILSAQAKLPSWAKNATHRSGNSFQTVCSGMGASIDSARSESLAGCKATAIREWSPTEKYSSLAIETDREAAVHTEVESTAVYKNIQCNQINEEIEELEGQYRVWLKCKFDLGKIAELPIESKPSVTSIRRAEEINTHAITTRKAEFTSITKKTVFITSIPSCTDILIEGGFSKVVRCTSVPTPIVVSSNNKKIIIRKKGYKPKTLQVSELLGAESENLTVHLDSF